MMDVDFPRGDVVKQVAQKKKSGKRKLNKENEDEKSAKKFVRSKYDLVWTNRLNLQAVTNNLLALGCVKSCNESEIRLELIDGVHAVVPITAVSNRLLERLKRLDADNVPKLDKMFVKGQMLVIKVTSIKTEQTAKSRKGQIVVGSTDPQEVNVNLLFTKLQIGQVVMASIKSIEDKGFQMDMGSTTTFGFLPFTRCHVDPLNATVGQVMLCTVSEASGPENRLVQLTTSEPLILSSIPTRDQLLPGVVVKGVVDKVVPGGMYVKFDERMIGFVSKSKINERFGSMNMIENGTEITCIVTFQTPHANMIGFSGQSFLFNHSNFEDRTSFADLHIGEKCKGIVKHAGGKTGVYFELENDSDVVVFVPATELQCENDIDKIKTKYIVGSASHDLRITGQSLMNRLLYATNKKSRINQPIVSVETAVPGTLVKATVERTTLSGIFVKVCDNLHGFIPAIHSADIPINDLEAKFTNGQVIKVRVLSSDVDRHRLILTAKKSLIRSQSPIVASYDVSMNDVVCDGTVVHIKSNGLLVTFYNNVKGWLNRSELEAAGIVEDPEQCFLLGQIVRVQITSVDPSRRRISLAPSNLIPLDRKQITKSASVGIAAVVQAKVVEVTPTGLNVVYGDDYDLRGFIPSYHLSDSLSDLDLLTSTFKIGDVIKPCVVFSKGSVVTLSTKPAVVESAKKKTIPESFDRLEEGNFVVGVVSKIHPDLGYFVDLPGGLLHALAPYSSTDKSEHKLAVGQTVVGRINQVDAEKQRFRMNLKLNVCLVDGTQLSVQLLKKYFAEHRKIIDNAIGSSDATLSSLAREITAGKIVKCVVTKITPVGLICTLENGIKGVVLIEHLDKSLEDYKEDDVVDAFVLYVDLKEVCLELSLLSDVIKKAKKLLRETTSNDIKRMEVKVDQKLRATVLLVKKDFILVTLDMHASGAIAYMPGRLHYNDTVENCSYKIGDRPPVIVKELFDGKIFVGNVKNEKLYGSTPVKEEHVDAALQKWVTVDIGKIYDGHVLEKDNFYVDIFIKKSQKARIHVSELSDTFVNGSSPMDAFASAPNKPVRVKVIGFIKCPNGIRAAECTMKKSKMEAVSNKKNVVYYKQTYRKGERIYVFIDHFKNDVCHVEVTPEWKGFVPISQLSVDEKKPEDFKNGQVYLSYVVSVQAKEKRLYLSFLPPKERKRKKLISKTSTEDEEPTVVGTKRHRTKTENSASSSISEPEFVPKKLKTDRRRRTSSSSEKLPRLKVDAGFNWTPDRFSMKNLMEVGLDMKTNVNDEEEVSIKNECSQSVGDDEKPTSSVGDEKVFSDDEIEIDRNISAADVDVDETKRKPKTKGKFERDKIEEQQLIQKELSLLDPERNLDTAEDFDRLLMGSPDSSLLWLRYMAMYLQTAEISKARAVAERALKTISMREENEKFNVWTAMLNMENAYGTKDTLNEIFERAKLVNEPLKVYRQLLKIFERSNKTKEADDLLDEMIKKFKSEFDVWILAGEHFYSSHPAREDKSREIMQRSMKSLPEHQQIDVVSRFAQMEFKYADSERGRTLFENLLNEYPKRTDIWSVYIDMTCKHRNADEARVLFERVTSLKLTVHKLKSFYKKWSEFETRHGTEETRRQVEERSLKIFKSNSNEDQEEEEEEIDES